MNVDNILIRVDGPDRETYVVMEDDGRVAYAYRFRRAEIVADVWLYNVGESPAKVDWNDKSAMPFPNPTLYCLPNDLPRLTKTTMVTCHWAKTGISIIVGGIEWARLEDGTKPG